MLTRNDNLASPDRYFADSLLTKPTVTQSVFENMAAGFATPFAATQIVSDQLSQHPEGAAAKSALDSLDLQNATPGTTNFQRYANEGANMIGFALNPMSWLLGEGGGVAGRVLGRGIGRVGTAATGVPFDAASVFARTPLKEMVNKRLSEFVPETIGKVGEEKALTLGLVSDKAAAAFGTLAGAGVPQAIVDNYQADTNHIEWGGTAREMGEMGAFGIAIGSIPFAWGVLRGKVNRGLAEDASSALTLDKVNAGLAKGLISQDEHAWLTDYLTHLNNPGDAKMGADLKDRASELINANGHKANTISNEAMFEMLTPDNMKNLQSVIADQLTGEVPEQFREALSNFIIHNRLDEMRQEPNSLDGVRGYVDFVAEKLRNREAKVAEANKILDDHLTKGAKENLPFSQKELLRHFKRAQFEASHVKQLPVVIPDNMINHLKVLDKINRLKDKLAKQKRKNPEVAPNKQTLRRIEELKNSLPKILTPKEELLHIKNKLLTPQGLSKGWEHSNEYHRLLDLSNVWHNAKTLLDRIHLENQYERQNAFHDLAKNILNIADSDLPNLADRENVMDYLRSRIEGKLSQAEDAGEVSIAADKSREVPTDAEGILSDQKQQIENTSADDARDEFDSSLEKFNEFQTSPTIFKNLLSCVMGALNG